MIMANPENESALTKKKISDLRVVDLRFELEKRGLDKTGVKNALVERLTLALKTEGQDPEEYLFEVTADGASPVVKKAPVKRSGRRLAKDGQEEVDDDEKVESEDEKVVEEQADIHKENSTAQEQKEKAIRIVAERNGIQEAGDGKDGSGHLSPPKPESAPVVAPLTVEDTITLSSSSNVKTNDNASLIVHVDDTQSDLDDLEITSSDKGDHVLEDHIVSQSSEQCDTSQTQRNSADGNKYHEEEEDQAEPSEAEKKATERGEDQVEEEVTMDTGENSEPKEGDDAKAAETSEETDATATAETKSPSKDQKASSEKVKRIIVTNRNLWISGLSRATRAADLKQLFSKHGKVAGAKIVTNSRAPGARCFGFVTMASSKEATICIQNLHRTELLGRVISVEKQTSRDHQRDGRSSYRRGAPPKEKDSKEKDPKAEGVDGEKKSENGEDGEKKEGESEEKKDGEEAKEGEETKTEDGKDSGKGEHRLRRSRSRSRGRRFGRRFGRGFGFRSRGGFNIRNSFRRGGPFRPGIRERFREGNEFRQRELERKHRDELFQLERERDRLRVEREKLERERIQMVRLEREKQRFERERIERERDELRRQQMNQFDDPRRAPKRTFGGREFESDSFDRKRPNRNDMPGGRLRDVRMREGGVGGGDRDYYGPKRQKTGRFPSANRSFDRGNSWGNQDMNKSFGSNNVGSSHWGRMESSQREWSGNVGGRQGVGMGSQSGVQQFNPGVGDMSSNSSGNFVQRYNVPIIRRY